MPTSREERRARIAARKARRAARRERGEARMARVQARREQAARRADPLTEFIEYETVAAGRPPKEVALTVIADNVAYLETRKVESSWVHSIHLVRDLTVDRDRLAVTFLDLYTCIYTSTSVRDYFAMKAAPSKGKHVWAYLYRLGRRVISDETKGHLAKLGLL